MTGTKRTSLNDSIKFLLSAGHDEGAIELALHFFNFASLLRWPRNPKRASSAAKIMMARYVADEFASLDPKEQHSQLPLLMAYAHPTQTIIDCLSDENAVTMLELGETQNQELVANIVRYLISPNANAGIPAKKPSLKKAFYLCEQDALYGQTPRSWKAFSDAWASFKDVGVFLFVRQHGRTRYVSPHPLNQSFAPTINKFLHDQSSVVEFFARSKWVAERLNSVLDPRAIREINAPLFPSDLVPKGVALTPTSSTMEQVISRYRS